MLPHLSVVFLLLIHLVMPPTALTPTFPIIMRWFLIQIAYNNGNVVQTDKVAQTNGGD